MDNYIFNIVLSKNKLPVPVISKGVKTIRLHSIYDPKKEAERFIRNFNFKNIKLIIVIGFGFAYHIEEIINNIEGYDKIIVIEKSSEIINAYKNKYNNNIFDKIELLLNINNESLINRISEFINFSNFNKIKIVNHNKSISIFPEYYSEVIINIKKIIEFTKTNFATVGNFGIEWTKNIISNLNFITNSYSLSSLQKKFKNLPCIIVSAGPSLDLNVKELKKLKNKCLILSTDTAYSRLLKENIIPDFVCAADSQYINYLKLKNLGDSKVNLLAASIIWSEINNEFKHRYYFKIRNNVEKYFDEIFDNMAFLKTGGSVATVLFSFANFTGCDPIIFVGQDFSFYNNQRYAKGIQKYNSYYATLNKFNTIESFDLTVDENLMDLIDINGERVTTTETLFYYKNWLELEAGSIPAKVINSTEGGILKENVEIMPLAESIDKYISKNKINVFELLYLNNEHLNIDKEYISVKLETIKNESSNLIKEIDDYLKNIETGSEDARKYMNMKVNTSKINNLLSNLIQYEVYQYNNGMINEKEFINIIRKNLSYLYELTTEKNYYYLNM